MEQSQQLIQSVLLGKELKNYQIGRFEDIDCLCAKHLHAVAFTKGVNTKGSRQISRNQSIICSRRDFIHHGIYWTFVDVTGDVKVDCVTVMNTECHCV